MNNHLVEEIQAIKSVWASGHVVEVSMDSVMLAMKHIRFLCEALDAKDRIIAEKEREIKELKNSSLWIDKVKQKNAEISKLRDENKEMLITSSQDVIQSSKGLIRLIKENTKLKEALDDFCVKLDEITEELRRLAA